MDPKKSRTQLDLSVKALEGVHSLLFQYGNLKKRENCCIISDDGTSHIGEAFYRLATRRRIAAKHFVIPPFRIHGEEPPEEVAVQMKQSQLIVGLTRLSMAHSKARHEACRQGARYLSLPDYSEEVLSHPSLRVSYPKIVKEARDLERRLTGGKKVLITTKAGTRVVLDIRGRTANYCPGFVRKGVALGSPPDIEVNIAPRENASHGIVVVDGSVPVPRIGKLSSPIRLRIRQGKIEEFIASSVIRQKLEKLFAPFPAKARVLAEFGIGLNPKAAICGNMLIDEGCRGTFHFGFGSNETIGGENKVPFHVDFIFYADSFTLDNRLVSIPRS